MQCTLYFFQYHRYFEQKLLEFVPRNQGGGFVQELSKDHPDVDELHKRVSAIDDKISIATVYRTVKLFEEAGILIKHDFKAGKARYEINDDHNHLIDINSGEIVEFVDKDIEELQKKIAKKLGYNLVDHKLELYGSKIKK